MRRRCCPAPAPAPFTYYPNCPAEYIRACSDGTGTVVGRVPGAYFYTKLEDGETPTQAQDRANEYAEKLAKGRALNKVLTCNTISPEDINDCGLVEERPSFDPACADLYCNGSGIQYCDENSIPYNRVSTL